MRDPVLVRELDHVGCVICVHASDVSVAHDSLGAGARPVPRPLWASFSLTPNGAVHSDDFGFAWVNPQFGQDRHEARTESVELLL